MKKQTGLQQGDCVLFNISKIPDGAISVQSPDIVILHGEGTHEHRLSTLDGVEMYKKDGIKFARIAQPISLDHTGVGGKGAGEHRSIALAPGVYQFGQVQEYDYLQELSRPVVD